MNKQQNKLVDTGNKLVAARGEGGKGTGEVDEGIKSTNFWLQNK